MQTSPFLAEGYSLYGEYYYNDGSFKAYGYPDESGWDNSFELTTTVKGSFAQISSVLHEDAVEQEYTTADGTALIMFTEGSSNRAGFIFFSEGCYVTAIVFTSDEQQARALADAIDFGAIAALFETPQARAATAQSVAAYDEVRANRTYIDTGNDETERAIAFLGDWWLTELPEGYELDQMSGGTPDFIEDMYTVTRSYGAGALIFSYHDLRPLDQADEAERLSLDTYVESYFQYDVTEFEVNGYRAYLAQLSDDFWMLMWVDTERELRFVIHAYDMTQQEILAAAESVEGTEAASLPRRNGLSEDERFAQSVAAYRADYVSEPVYEGNWVRCYYSLGSYTLPLPAGYTHTGDTSYIRHEYYDQYTGQVISRYFRTDGDEYIRLSYKRFEGDEIDSPEATRAEFEAEQEYRSRFASVQSCTVNGFEGYFSDVPDWNYAGEYQRRCLNWLDTDLGLWFILTSSEDIGDEALLSMAESVAEDEMPERYVCDLGASEGPPLGDTLSDGLTYDAAIDELGDLVIPSLHDRILAGTQRGRYEQNMFYWYLEAAPCAYEGLTTLYRDGIALTYMRYWTDDSYTVSRGGRSYADMKHFYGAAYEGDGFRDDLVVNGHDAFALLHDGWNELIWYDSGRDLVFTLSDTPDVPRSVYELIKLAEEIQ